VGTGKATTAQLGTSGERQNAFAALSVAHAAATAMPAAHLPCGISCVIARATGDANFTVG